MKNDKAVLLYNRLLEDDKDALEDMYLEYKEEFIYFFKKYKINHQELLDLYQESIIVIYQKVVNDKLKLEKSNLKTYLFGIGKNKVYNYFKQKKNFSENQEELEIEMEYKSWTAEPSIYEKQLAKNLKLMSSSCSKILELFYFRNLTIKEIVAMTDYKDENTVKSHKSRCLKSLKAMCNQN